MFAENIELIIAELLCVHFGNIVSFFLFILILHWTIVLAQIGQAFQAVSVLLLLRVADIRFLVGEVASLLVIQFFFRPSSSLGCVTVEVSFLPWLLTVVVCKTGVL